MIIISASLKTFSLLDLEEDENFVAGLAFFLEPNIDRAPCCGPGSSIALVE
jgi:hypothetical protein